LIKPKLIVALGRVAGQTLLNVDKSLKSLRNTFHDYHGTPLMVTYHPAALLRNQDLKRPTWEDFKTIKDYLDSSK
jgi:DNA polymerase